MTYRGRVMRLVRDTTLRTFPHDRHGRVIHGCIGHRRIVRRRLQAAQYNTRLRRSSRTGNTIVERKRNGIETSLEYDETKMMVLLLLC